MITIRSPQRHTFFALGFEELFFVAAVFLAVEAFFGSAADFFALTFLTDGAGFLAVPFPAADLVVVFAFDAGLDGCALGLGFAGAVFLGAGVAFGNLAFAGAGFLAAGFVFLILHEYILRGRVEKTLTSLAASGRALGASLIFPEGPMVIHETCFKSRS